MLRPIDHRPRLGILFGNLKQSNHLLKQWISPLVTWELYVPQLKHLVVNSSFQSASQYAFPSSRKNGLLPNNLPQYVQVKHSGWKCFPMAFKQSPCIGRYRLAWNFEMVSKYCNYLDFTTAFVTWWSQEFLETIFAIEIAFLFNESNVLQRASAVSIDAYEMIGAPDASQCRYKWSSVSLSNWKLENINFRAEDGGRTRATFVLSTNTTAKNYLFATTETIQNTKYRFLFLRIGIAKSNQTNYMKRKEKNFQNKESKHKKLSTPKWKLNWNDVWGWVNRAMGRSPKMPTW